MNSKRVCNGSLLLVIVVLLVALSSWGFSSVSAGDDLHLLLLRKTSFVTPIFGAARAFSKKHNITLNFYLSRDSKDLRNYVIKASQGEVVHFVGSVVRVYYSDCQDRSLYGLLLFFFIKIQYFFFGILQCISISFVYLFLSFMALLV